jgi:hypothetical protein
MHVDGNPPFRELVLEVKQPLKDTGNRRPSPEESKG